MVDAELLTVPKSVRIPQGGIAVAHRLGDCLGSANTQVGVVLPGEGRTGQILHGAGGADRHRLVAQSSGLGRRLEFGEPGAGDGSAADEVADCLGGSVAAHELGDLSLQRVDELRVGVGGDDEAAGYGQVLR